MRRVSTAAAQRLLFGGPFACLQSGLELLPLAVQLRVPYFGRFARMNDAIVGRPSGSVQQDLEGLAQLVEEFGGLRIVGVLVGMAC